MYNTRFPSWSVATSTGASAYDGQLAYAYAKRGQVLLCERWAATFNNVFKVVSCHPGNESLQLKRFSLYSILPKGWTGTEGVDAAYGSSKSLLEPLRSLWQGAEGIIWLAVAPSEKIESGGKPSTYFTLIVLLLIVYYNLSAFYLDRQPQRKHMSGPFYMEGSYTRNTPQEVDEMMERLEKWSEGDRS